MKTFDRAVNGRQNGKQKIDFIITDKASTVKNITAIKKINSESGS